MSGLRGWWELGQQRVHQGGVEVIPQWVVPLDQVRLPVARPAFQGFLPLDGRHHALVRLVPDQALAAVPLGEAGERARSVLPRTVMQTAGDADVERAVPTARHHVDRDQAVR